MDRILINTPTVLTVTFSVDGLATDPTPQTVSVNVFRDDGTQIVTAAAASRVSAGVYSYPVSAAVTSTLDVLSVTWTSTNLGTLTTTAEVVGGYLFTIAELRAQSPALANVTNYPTAGLVELRTELEDAVEQELGYALVPRYGTTTFVGQNTTLQLKPYLRSVRSITDYGQALTVSSLDISTYGFVSGYTFQGPTVAMYEHGLDPSSPGFPRAKKMALQLAKAWAITGPIDDRATSFTSDVGITSTLATPGLGGSIFGPPAVDQWIRSARLVGFA